MQTPLSFISSTAGVVVRSPCSKIGLGERKPHPGELRDHWLWGEISRVAVFHLGTLPWEGFLALSVTVRSSQTAGALPSSQATDSLHGTFLPAPLLLLPSVHLVPVSFCCVPMCIFCHRASLWGRDNATLHTATEWAMQKPGYKPVDDSPPVEELASSLEIDMQYGLCPSLGCGLVQTAEVSVRSHSRDHSFKHTALYWNFRAAMVRLLWSETEIDGGGQTVIWSDSHLRTSLLQLAILVGDPGLGIQNMM